MKFSDLKGRAVVNINDSQKAGDLEDILIEPGSRKPVGIQVKSGLFGRGQVIPMSEVRSVGPDAITFAGQPDAPQAEGAAQPEPSTAAAAPQPVTVSSLLGDQVITDTGTLVGDVQDVVIDPTTLAVTGYEVKGGGLFSRAQEIPITAEVRHGDKLITVPASLLNQPE